MTDSIHIRPAEPGDVPAISDLFRTTVLTVSIRDYAPEQVAVWALQADFDFIWLEKIEQTHFLLAEIGHEPAGFGSLTTDCTIEMLYTSAHHQGKGVAKALLAALESEARRRGYDWLVTDASKTARPVFEKGGFVLVKEQTVQLRGTAFTNYKMIKDL